jgi:hypothetical protein
MRNGKDISSSIFRPIVKRNEIIDTKMANITDSVKAAMGEHQTPHRSHSSC